MDTLNKVTKASIVQQYADYGSPVYAPPQREGRFADAAPKGPSSSNPFLDPESFTPANLAGVNNLAASLTPKLLNPTMKLGPAKPCRTSATQGKSGGYKQREVAAIQADVEAVGRMLDSSKAERGRGLGEVWPYPLDLPCSPGGWGAAAAGAGAKGERAGRTQGSRPAGGKNHGECL